MKRRNRPLAVILILALTMLRYVGARPGFHNLDTVNLRGQTFSIHVYGNRSGQPVVISSGDGGWVNLAPHVAETLAAAGFFVVGFDAKAYLARFTAGSRTLTTTEEPGDYSVLIRAGRARKRAQANSDRRVGGRWLVGARRLRPANQRINKRSHRPRAAGSERARLAMDGLAGLFHACPAERAVVQHRGTRRCPGTAPARRNPFQPRRVRAPRRRTARCSTRRRGRRVCGSSTRATTGSAGAWRNSTAGCSKRSTGCGAAPRLQLALKKMWR